LHIDDDDHHDCLQFAQHENEEKEIIQCFRYTNYFRV